jgi:DNA polymerase III sliding clamp (beta) subunit (PCNA family)
MLAFVNVHNLTKTAREVVAGFQRTTAADPAPEFSPVSAVAIMEPEPEPAPVPQSTTTTATADRRRFLADCRQAEKHSGRSAFSTVLLSYDGKRVSLDSNNGDFLLSQTVDYVNASGPAAAVAVPVKKLVTLLSKFDAREVAFSIVCHPAEDSAEVVLSVDGGEFTIPAELASGAGETAANIATRFEFFRGPFPAEFATMTTAAELCDALTRCQGSTDTESTRYALSGFRFDIAPDRFTIAATDSRRLTVRHIPTTTAGTFPTVKVGTLSSYVSPESLGYVFPLSAAVRIIEGLKRVPDGSAVAIAAHYQEPHIVPTKTDDDGNVIESKTVSNVSSVVIECCDDSGIRFSVRSRVVEGRFPRYQDVIPRTGNLTATADRKKLLQAITTAAAVLSEESRGLDIVIRENSGAGELRGESTENGKSKVQFNWSIVSGGIEYATTDNATEFGITIDPNYLTDYLKTSTAERVAFRFVDSETAIVIEENDSAAGCFVLMPLSRDR